MNINEKTLILVLDKIKEKILPDKKLKTKMEKTLNQFKKKLRDIIRNNQIKANLELVGSYVKETWLPQKTEVDIFLVYDSKNVIKKMAVKDLEKLKTAYDTCEDRHAQHPYLRGTFKDLAIDIVPSYKIDDPNSRFTAVDRTPLHTEYILKKINESLSTEIRLLKRFLQGTGLYGAEIKIKGFSGYLCELLIIKYKSFINVLIASQNWQSGEIIDIEKHHKDTKELGKLFDSPLIVIDPIDPNRNVAAALSKKNLYKFIELSKKFLEKPNEEYFFPPIIKPTDFKNISEKIKNYLFISTIVPKIPADILWGQLYSSLKGIEKFLILNDFEVKKASIWSDEQDIILFIYHLTNLERNQFKRKIGPEIGGIGEKEFLKKYQDQLDDKKLLKNEGRWIILEKREITKIEQLLESVIRDNKLKEIKLGSHIRKALKKKFKIYIGSQISELYSKYQDLAILLMKD